MEEVKKRRPIVAFFLSVVSPGLGQIYNGQFKKGLFCLVGFLLAYILLSFLLLTFYGMIFYVIIMIGFFIFILSDALRGATRLTVII